MVLHEGSDALLPDRAKSYDIMYLRICVSYNIFSYYYSNENKLIDTVWTGMLHYSIQNNFKIGLTKVTYDKIK